MVLPASVAAGSGGQRTGLPIADPGMWFPMGYASAGYGCHICKGIPWPV